MRAAALDQDQCVRVASIAFILQAASGGSRQRRGYSQSDVVDKALRVVEQLLGEQRREIFLDWLVLLHSRWPERAVLELPVHPPVVPVPEQRSALR